MRDPKEIACKIKTIREKKGLSQERFGSKIGVSGKSVSAYENGRCRPPLKVLEAISETYDTTVIDLAQKKRDCLLRSLLLLKEELLKIEEIIK